MQWLSKSLKISLALFAAGLLYADSTLAQHYVQNNLVSDADPSSPFASAPIKDPNLINPWGLTRSPNTSTRKGSPWWIGDNNSGTSTLYDGGGNPQNFFPDPHPDANGNGITSPFNNFIMVAPPPFAPGTQSAPTGVVVNGSATDFLLAPNKQAIFLFATEDGTISGWNPGVDPINSVRVVDHSSKDPNKGAVYKGMTSGEIDGQKVLYAANFRSGKVEVYSTNFQPVALGEDAFDDDDLPRDFAPFNVQNIGGSIFVTYAKQDAARHDPLSGDGFGFVDIYSTKGRLQGRLQHGDWFNAPWGVVWTPRDYGEFSNTILVGNFRSGWIAAFNGFTKKFTGFVKNPDNSLVTIGGLWSLTFGNNGNAGPSTTLFFTAGGADESHGVFGTLTPVDAEQDGDEE